MHPFESHLVSTVIRTDRDRAADAHRRVAAALAVRRQRRRARLGAALVAAGRRLQAPRARGHGAVVRPSH